MRTPRSLLVRALDLTRPVIALPLSNTMPTFDREVLQKLRASATSVTLTAGETATVQLRIVQ